EVPGVGLPLRGDGAELVADGEHDLDAETGEMVEERRDVRVGDEAEELHGDDPRPAVEGARLAGERAPALVPARAVGMPRHVAHRLGLPPVRATEVAAAGRLECGRVPGEGGLDEAGPGFHRADVEDDALGHSSPVSRALNTAWRVPAGRCG